MNAVAKRLYSLDERPYWICDICSDGAFVEAGVTDLPDGWELVGELHVCEKCK